MVPMEETAPLDSWLHVPHNENNQSNTSTSNSNGAEDLVEAPSDAISTETFGVTPQPQNVSGSAPSPQSLGIITARPKRPDYAVLEARLNSFKEWPTKHHMKPCDLAQAGFFAPGAADCCRCFYCGNEVHNWGPRDNAWVEHARWSPKCAFVQQKLGKEFIEATHAIVQERDEEKEDDDDSIGFEEVLERRRQNTSFETARRFNNALDRDPAVLSVIEAGFDRERVIELAQSLPKPGQPLSSKDLYKALTLPPGPNGENVTHRPETLNQDIQETMDELRDENVELRQQTTCKICMDKEVAVVFLPCGHFVCCIECSCALTACTMCRVGIKGTVRAYMQ